MKHFIISLLIVVSAIFVMTGCSTVPTGDQIKADALEWLRDNKGVVKDGLVIVGKNVMQQATSGDERKAIADQMWTLSVMFNSLATGKAVDRATIDASIKSFTRDSKAPGFTDFVSDATIVWSGVFNKIKLADDPQLFIDYLIVFSTAAQEVASIYKDGQ